MFTGLVEEIGKITEVRRTGEAMKLTIEASHILTDVNSGDSIAVNGICLTVTNYTSSSFTIDVMPETFYHTNLNQATKGTLVNTERAMTPNKRFGGHFVAGHVDGIAQLVDKKEKDNAVYFTFRTEEELTKYMIPKGSIAIDGISLTLVNVEDDSFTVSIIPHTLKETTLGFKQVGQTANIEVDMLGKYIEKFMNRFSEAKSSSSSKISETLLRENGFI